MSLCSIVQEGPLASSLDRREITPRLSALNARSTGSSGASRLCHAGRRKLSLARLNTSTSFLSTFTPMLHHRGVKSVSRDGRSTRRRWKAMAQDAHYTHGMATHPLLTGSGLAVLSLPLHLVVPAETSVVLASLTLALIAVSTWASRSAMGDSR